MATGGQQSERKSEFTKDGYEICSSRAVPIPIKKRYINPKMEEELAKFKKKVAQRFSQKEISDAYVFPKMVAASLHSPKMRAMYSSEQLINLAIPRPSAKKQPPVA